MFKYSTTLVVIIFVIFLAGSVSASQVKTFLPERSWQITIDTNGFEPFDLIGQGTLLAGQTKDGVTVTIVVYRTEPNTIPSAVQSNRCQSILSMFGKMETMEQIDVNDMTVIMCEWDQPHIASEIDVPFRQAGFAIKNRWSCNGYLSKDDISFDIHLSGDIKSHSKKQLLEMLGSVRIETSNEMADLQKLDESISKISETEDDVSVLNQRILEVIQDFSKKYPANSDIQVFLGNYYMSIRQIKGAAKAYKKALANHKLQPLLNPISRWQCCFNLGLIYIEDEDYGNSQKYFKKANLLAKGIKDPQIIAASAYGLSASFAYKGEYDNSVDYLIEAVELNEECITQAQVDPSFKQVLSRSKFKKAIADKSRKNEPSQKIWSKNAKMLALGCSAVLNERNGDKHDTLSPRDITEENIKSWKESLDRWWGATNREELLGNLEWVEKGGHRLRFEYVGEFIEGLSKEQYGAIIESEMFDLEHLYEILIAKKYYRKLGAKSLLGWDYSRYICLCRWGYLVGWLSEDEAWERIMPIAEILQGKFNSWEELGQNYLIGREFWSYQYTKESSRIYKEAFDQLMKMESSPWNKISWSTDLK